MGTGSLWEQRAGMLHRVDGMQRQGAMFLASGATSCFVACFFIEWHSLVVRLKQAAEATFFLGLLRLPGENSSHVLQRSSSFSSASLHLKSMQKFNTAPTPSSHNSQIDLPVKRRSMPVLGKADETRSPGPRRQTKDSIPTDSSPKMLKRKANGKGSFLLRRHTIDCIPTDSSPRLSKQESCGKASLLQCKKTTRQTPHAIAEVVHQERGGVDLPGDPAEVISDLGYNDAQAGASWL